MSIVKKLAFIYVIYLTAVSYIWGSIITCLTITTLWLLFTARKVHEGVRQSFPAPEVDAEILYAFSLTHIKCQTPRTC